MEKFVTPDSAGLVAGATGMAFDNKQFQKFNPWLRNSPIEVQTLLYP